VSQQEENPLAAAMLLTEEAVEKFLDGDAMEVTLGAVAMI
jgi:hypothetical protein